MDDFRALVAENADDDVKRELRTLGPDDLPDGDVVIRVAWSSVNYKDALAVSAKGQVAQISPLVPGIDLAGEVVEAGGGFSEGGQGLVPGYDLGGAHPRGRAGDAGGPAG